MSISQTPSPRSIRLSEEEAWDFVTKASIGIMTTLRRDGVPISLPLWFACIDKTIYLNTRGKKLLRINHDARASFLVETGEKWAELMAVHLTGKVATVEIDAELRSRIRAQMDEKYSALRTPIKTMPTKTAETYSSGSKRVAFSADPRILSWDNSRIPTQG